MMSTEKEAGLLPAHAEVFAVAAIAVAASITSVTNGFALDDIPIVLRNEAVHSVGNLFQHLSRTYWPVEYGASLYRPFTSIAFSLQWLAGGGSPLPFHVVSVVLYACVSLLVLRLGRQVAGSVAGFAAAAIFAAHPLHVEAVANVVGQSELWAAMLVLAALTRWLDLRARGPLSPYDIALLAAAYGAALMFKEHAIVLPALIVAAELILPARGGRSIRSILPLLAAMVLVAMVFLLVRTAVIGKFAGGSTAVVFAGQDYGTRFFTMLAVMPEWGRLFFWPSSLSADYSPPRIATKESFEIAMALPIAVVAVLAAVAIRVRRTDPGASFGSAFVGVTLLIPSNLVVVTGFALAERSLFLPSAGVAVVLGYVFAFLWRRASEPAPRRVVAAAAVGVLLAGVAKSSTRGPVWKDNEALFHQTVKDTPRSYRAHLQLGELLTDQRKTAEGLNSLVTAVALSRPQDYWVRWFVADRFHAAGQLDVAVRFYMEALTLKPSDAKVRYGTAMALLSLGDSTRARAIAAEGAKLLPADERFAGIVQTIDKTKPHHPGA
jgi:hypothetical protein